MKKYKTSDGYYVYQVNKEEKKYFLADKKNYKKDIEKLIENINDAKHDSNIFIFGIDTGCYMEELEKHICVKNSVYIIEPNWDIYRKSRQMATNQIQILFFDENIIKQIINRSIKGLNFNRFYFHVFGNYSAIYEKEIDCLTELLDYAYLGASTFISLAERFKKEFLKNFISNLSIIKKATPIQNYFLTRQNIPAIVVSAGPSLDRNLAEMEKHRDKLKNMFIISGSRTAAALLKHGIEPNMIVSIDPVEANYDMMKECLNLNIPLAFYEYSNRRLLREYKGEKAYIPVLLPRILESCKKMQQVYFGGSVAHTCIDIAVKLGCSPIILAGQDFAFTDDKHHADLAVYDYDKQLNYSANMKVKNINGEQIGTTATLDFYRKGLEEYITIIKKINNIEFINCSYGAEIEGAVHKELQDIFLLDIFQKEVNHSVIKGCVDLQEQDVIDSMLFFIEHTRKRGNEALLQCEEIIKENHIKCLMDLEEDDWDLHRIVSIMEIAEEFMSSPISNYLGGYYNKFIYKCKEELFTMYAMDYERQTSDLQYQARMFKEYYIGLFRMLEEVKELIMETVNECKENHII